MKNPHSGRPGWQFFQANLQYMLAGRLRSKRGYQPPAGHDVPADFAMIGVATGPDPAMDDRVIEALTALGIRQVRLDFTYGDAEKHAGRLLQRLHADSFDIMLHLVQPFEAARHMDQSAQQVIWQNFVADTLKTFSGKISVLEVGSTINRKRWAGYTLEGFLTAWEIAYQEARAAKIALAGPSITDFEPPYNIGLLSLMQRRNLLPDIHTDNLFSERCTEPERDDHKILGHRLAPLGGFRLVKKAFVLQEIGQHFSVPTFYSPSAFWTLPRIHRLLADGEQKQADYLARYMLLCAASGAMARAGWGPMVCHREGLIDDGDHQYPKLERITHYASCGGSEFRLRPAFMAYQAFAAMIPGRHYQACLDDANGLEVHAFTSTKTLTHAVWTINGRAAAMQDIYQDSDLKDAACYSRDGVLLANMPDFATESVIYLRWPLPRAVQVKKDAALIKDLSIHAHLDSPYFQYRVGAWRGAIAATDLQASEILKTALNPSLIGAPPKEAILRKARNAIWTIPDPRDPTKKLVIKQPVRMHPHKKFLDRFKPSKGLRSWNGACELLRRGVETARPVAYFELINDKSLTMNYYICEYVDADFSARDIFSAFAQGEASFQGITPEMIYQQLADYLLLMHGRGVFFRDLSGGNILVKKQADGSLGFSLIDTGRAHFYQRGTALFERLSDLSRICNKLHSDGRNQFMGLYMARLGKDFGFWYRLPFYVYNAKVALKRTMKGKTLKKWFNSHR